MYFVMYNEDGEILQSGSVQDECRDMLEVPEGLSLLETDQHYPFLAYCVELATRTVVPKGTPQ